MAFEHPSGLPLTHDREAGRSDTQGLVFQGDMRFLQSAELNGMQTVIRERGKRVGRLVAKDGDRVEGAAAVLLNAQPDDVVGDFVMTAGKLYVDGDVLPVAQAIIEDVPLVGRVEIGVSITRAWVTSETDPTLLGLAAGSLAEGEPGAARERVTIAWALADPDIEAFVSVYTVQDGTVLDQTPPPALSGVNQAIAIYDRDAHGHYIVSGCRVTALGLGSGDQVFSIEEGVANIGGFKRSRQAALRHAEPEEADVEEVAGEPHIYPGGASATILTNFRPIAALGAILVTKEVIETVTRGAVAGTADLLANNSVTAVLEVKQGGTTYVLTTDYVRSGDSISWAPGGAEPATSSSYTVKYQYLDAVTPDASDAISITVSGGVADTTVIFGYDYKLPRIDLMCLDQEGAPSYVKGISARKNPLPPVPPSDVLPLAEVTNNWITRPSVENNGIRAVPFDQQTRFNNAVVDLLRLMQLERINNRIDAREPVAKKGTFADPLTGDEFRDLGEAQTASVGQGSIELAIEPTFYEADLAAPVMLDWTEEVIIAQSLATGCMKINPYQNFLPMPAGLSMTPAADTWAVAQTVWASPATIEFNRGVRRDNGPLVVSSTDIQTVDQRSEQAEFLRQISVSFEIEGFGPGEVLETLLFDGVSVLPGGPTVAAGDGGIEGNFNIPANIPAGTKQLYAEGAGGSFASAAFVGQGLITTDTMRRVTTIERWTRPPTVVLSAVTMQNGQVRETGDHGGADPLAQTFSPPVARQIVGVDIRLCAIGSTSNSLLVEQVSVENGIPTTDVQAQAFVPMAGAVVGWKSARFSLPLLTLPDRESAFVVKTDDANHSLAIASLGAFDADNQQYVSGQPYAVGVLLSSSNARTWTPHQNDDLAFRIVAAKFGPLTKTVELGSFNLVNASDLQVRATVELPSADCSVVFEIERADGSIYRLLPYQVLQLTEFVTETVELRAILKGTAQLSPVLFNPVYLLAGRIETTGTYVTRAFKLGSAVRLTAYLKASLPFGSTVAVQYDKADDNWLTLTLAATEALADPAWVEQKREATPITATEGRIKITITGGPSARPRIGDLGAAIM